MSVTNLSLMVRQLHQLQAPFMMFLDHTHACHARQDLSGGVIGPTQRPLCGNKKLTQETDAHDPSGIRIRNPCKRAAVKQRLRQRGRWDRQL